MLDDVGKGIFDAPAKCLAEYSHDRVSEEGIDPSNIHFEDFFELDDPNAFKTRLPGQQILPPSSQPRMTPPLLGCETMICQQVDVIGI